MRKCIGIDVLMPSTTIILERGGSSGDGLVAVAPVRHHLRDSES